MTFVEKLLEKAKEKGIELNQEKARKLEAFAHLMIKENQKYNLTTITSENDIINKHFIDSFAGARYIEIKDKIVDIGSGAGFPSIPLRVVSNSQFLLLDSQMKRIGFLKKAIQLLDLDKMKTLHSRIEDAAWRQEYRHSFDKVVARAVAPLNVLIEYALPFLKKDGRLIAYKGKSFKEETAQAQNALKVMGGEIEDIFEYEIENEKRVILTIKNKGGEHKGYPRGQNKPRKQPL
ncbi:MAG: 16S rRNA (guanine(527)-N(7))-methyltransferase RsmG [Bacillota bacterium]